MREDRTNTCVIIYFMCSSASRHYRYYARLTDHIFIYEKTQHTCLPPTLKLYIPRNSRHENSTTYYDFCLYIHTSVYIHTYVVPYIQYF